MVVGDGGVSRFPFGLILNWVWVKLFSPPGTSLLHHLLINTLLRVS